MSEFMGMQDINLNNQRVIIREDFNVPIKNGVITDDTRIRAALPTIQLALQQNAAIILLSHRGRPTEGVYDQSYSLISVAKKLSELLNHPVRFEKDWIEGVRVSPGEIVLCENVRFLKGEKSCDETLSKKMAALCDVFVMDAFAAAHRAHASTTGVIKFAPKACAGPLLTAELTALSKALTHPKKPVIAVVGGAKVSSKLPVLEALLDKVDVLIVGGGIANTCLAAEGVDVGASLVEKDFLPAAKQLMQAAKQHAVEMPLPVDVLVGDTFSDNAKATIKLISEISADEMILDVGPKTAATYHEIMQAAKTIVWNGPVGVFEFKNFSQGTKALAQAIADSDAYSIAGGGDTLSAIAQCHVADDISYISTGGGAFLEWMEGKTLPAVAALVSRANRESI